MLVKLLLNVRVWELKTAGLEIIHTFQSCCDHMHSRVHSGRSLHLYSTFFFHFKCEFLFKTTLSLNTFALIHIITHARTYCWAAWTLRCILKILGDRVTASLKWYWKKKGRLAVGVNERTAVLTCTVSGEVLLLKKKAPQMRLWEIVQKCNKPGRKAILTRPQQLHYIRWMPMVFIYIICYNAIYIYIIRNENRRCVHCGGLWSDEMCGGSKVAMHGQ